MIERSDAQNFIIVSKNEKNPFNNLHWQHCGTKFHLKFSKTHVSFAIIQPFNLQNIKLQLVKYTKFETRTIIILTHNQSSPLIVLYTCHISNVSKLYIYIFTHLLIYNLFYNNIKINLIIVMNYFN